VAQLGKVRPRAVNDEGEMQPMRHSSGDEERARRGSRRRAVLL
jgi:hypothetical protein